jgi:hypothetical protein
VRLADLLAGLSIAIDLGFGLPPESAIRQCLVGTRLARAPGLADAEVRDSFFASLLLHVGCPGFSHETAALFGNEHAITRAAARTNLGAAMSLVLQARRLARIGSACEISIPVRLLALAGYSIWLAYGLAIGDVPMVLVDVAGVAGAALVLRVTLTLRRRSACPTF